MRVIVTGNLGYIGTVLTRILHEGGHVVVGLDSGLFETCLLGEEDAADRQIYRDVRDVDERDFEHCDAVVHLAALSNDPLGSIDERLTDEINQEGTLRCARMAKTAGVPRFVFSSSCSMYGASVGDVALDEEAPFRPVSAYAVSKVTAELKLNELADSLFCPVSLRNGTAYGKSPRMRFDLVVNEFVASALCAGEIHILSDGTPWRPLVNVEDICRAALLALEAPERDVRGQAFNVGSNEDNYTVRDVAHIVAGVCDSEVQIAGKPGADTRSYRVDFSKIADVLGYKAKWVFGAGIEDLRDYLSSNRARWRDHRDPKFIRLRRLICLQENELVNSQLRLISQGER